MISNLSDLQTVLLLLFIFRRSNILFTVWRVKDRKLYRTMVSDTTVHSSVITWCHTTYNSQAGVT